MTDEMVTIRCKKKANYHLINEMISVHEEEQRC